MNIVFWLLVGVAAVCVWLALSPLFKDIGGTAKGYVKEIKEELTKDEKEN